MVNRVTEGRDCGEVLALGSFREVSPQKTMAKRGMGDVTIRPKLGLVGM